MSWRTREFTISVFTLCWSNKINWKAASMVPGGDILWASDLISASARDRPARWASACSGGNVFGAKQRRRLARCARARHFLR